MTCSMLPLRSPLALGLCPGAIEAVVRTRAPMTIVRLMESSPCLITNSRSVPPWRLTCRGYSDGMRRRASGGMRYAPKCLTCSRHKKRRPAVKKSSTVQVFGNEVFAEQKLTIGVDLGDRWSFYCVLDEAGKIILEQKVPTTPEAMKQTFSRMPQSRIALETGTHSPWASRLLTELEHEVIVAHAQKVQL